MALPTRCERVSSYYYSLQDCWQQTQTGAAWTGQSSKHGGEPMTTLVGNETDREDDERESTRMWSAWQRWALDGQSCRHCPHEPEVHMGIANLPHFWRLPLRAELADLSSHRVAARVHHGRLDIFIRVDVESSPALNTVLCHACAGELGTAQAVCFSRATNIGEVVDTPFCY